MKLSTRSRYGLRFLIDLATHAGEGPVFLKDIARRQDLSEKYLWNVVLSLKSAGMVNSVRGPRGGYYLVGSPADITMNDIVSILEGPISLVDCVENRSSCNKADTCAARDVWVEAAGKIKNVLEGITLGTIVERMASKQS
ncbi:MAG: Rrf2 family transcriptional regulator [Deltaproteobacteria bacterium]|nr:Rrf2 family transcriptional regulator [Deltaproteobacteria bacterium]